MIYACSGTFVLARSRAAECIVACNADDKLPMMWEYADGSVRCSRRERAWRSG